LVSFIEVELGNLSPGNHPLRRLGNLSCTSAAERDGNLKAAANLKHGGHVAYRNAFDQPESRR
jgi:hypothetical protein